MKRLLQSGAGVVLLLVLLVLALINTAQLHNLEARLGAIESEGVKVGSSKTTTASASPAGAVFTAQAGSTCYASAEDEEALKDPTNLLKPFRYSNDWPARIQLGGALRRQIASDPPGLNLYASNNAADVSEMYRYAGARLAFQSTHDPDQWYPDLATRVTRSADGLVYDVWLRKGVKWHAPAADMADPRHAWLAADHEVVADDFVFALEVIRNPQVLGRAAAIRTYHESWKEIEVVDPHHFRVHFSEDNYMNQPVLLDFQPFPRWLYQYDEDGKPADAPTWGEKLNGHWYNQKAIGAGPYRFVEWEPGVKMVFEKAESYHLAKCLPAFFDRIEITMLKDQQAWLRYLSTKKLDYTQIMPAQWVNEVKDKEPYLGQDGLRLLVHPESSYFYFGWNQLRPMFADKRVRTALTLALDRQGLLDGVFGGLGAVTSGPFDQAHPCYDASIAPLPYDLTRAGQLLDEAGWVDSNGNGLRDKLIDGKRVEFEFTMVLYGGSTEYETLARVYGDALQRLGIRMIPQPLEWAAQLKKLQERDFDAYSGAWVPAWEVDLMQIWHSSEAAKPGSSNYVSFRSAEGDRIAEALRREFDPEKRVGLCHAFHALLADEQPYTFFYQRKRPMLYWSEMNTPVISRMSPHRDARLLSFAAPGN